MAVDALARRTRQDGYDEAKGQYHDILVERDQRIEELEKALKESKNENGSLRKERDNSVHECNSYKDQAAEWSNAKGKLEDEVTLWKGSSEVDRNDNAQLRKDNADHVKKNKNGEELIRQFKKRVSEQAASLQELHQQVDEAEAEKQVLQTANGSLAIAHESTINDVSNATKDFEEMFQDLGRELDLNGYIGHVRDLLASGQLKRRDSSLSLQRQLSPQKSDQELPNITGASLQDQLAAANDASSERSVPATGDEDEDEDETIQELGLGRTWTDYDYLVRLQDQEKKITELQRVNAELSAQVSNGDAAKIATSDNTTQTDVQEATTTTPPTLSSSMSDNTTQTDPEQVTKISPPRLGFSTIQSVDTEPVKAQPATKSLGFSSIKAVDTKPVKKPDVPDFSHKWRAKLAKEEEERIRRRARDSKQDSSEDEDVQDRKKPETLSIKLYPGVQTIPTQPPPITIRKKIVQIVPPTTAELWARVPFWYKMALYMLAASFFLIFASNISERVIWFAANDLTRQTVVRSGSGGIGSVVAPALTTIDGIFGIDNGFFG